MSPSDFLAKMAEFRQLFEDCDRVLAEHTDPGDFVPSCDPAFWSDFHRIEAAGRDRVEAEVSWLASLTQVDDLGPNGRALFLASAALLALRTMPGTTLEAGRHLFSELSPDASPYRVVGVCKLLEASGAAEAIPLLEALTYHQSTYVAREAGWCLNALRKQLTDSGVL